ncbi:hypothetical protein ACFFRR_007005 [Megaselia abdita]
MWIRSILLFAIYTFITIKGEKYIRFTNCDCSGSSGYVNVTRCTLKALSRERVTNNIELHVLKDVLNSTVQLSTFKMTSTGRYNPFLVNFRAKLCDLIKEKPGVNLILKQTIRIMKKYSNIVRCQLKAGVYYFRDVEIKYQMVKMLLDSGRYMLKLDFYEGIKRDFITLANYTAVVDVLDISKRNGRKKPKEVEIV